MRPVVFVLVTAVALAGCAKPFDEQVNQRTGPGALAMDYLGSKYGSILVEIDAVAGAEPNSSALEQFEREVENVLGKPVTVQVSREVTGRGATHAYTLAEVNALELEHRDRYSGNGVAVLYMLYLDGKFQSETTLGVAYHGSSVAMFKGTIRTTSKSDDQMLPTPGTLVKPREMFVERAVLVHEIGHILGLVNNGIPMVKPHEQKQDPNPDTPVNEGEKHSSSPESVMYWAVETAQITNVFTSGEDIPWRFDADDRADLRHAMEGERRGRATE